MIPPLWFRVMDPKLMQWAGGDISKVNVDPAKRAQAVREVRSKSRAEA